MTSVRTEEYKVNHVLALAPRDASDLAMALTTNEIAIGTHSCLPKARQDELP